MTTSNTSLFFATFTTIFVIADSAENLPIFMSLTARMTPNEREGAAWQATLTSFVVLTVFAFFSQQTLRLLGISVASMQISDDLLLFTVAMQLLSGREEDPDKPGTTNAALVPLGIPLLAGPDAVAAVMPTADQAAGKGVGGMLACVATVLLVHIIEQLTMRLANPLNRVLDENGTVLLTKVSGILLTAIAVQLIIDGVTSVVKGQMGPHPPRKRFADL